MYNTASIPRLGRLGRSSKEIDRALTLTPPLVALETLKRTGLEKLFTDD
jgi:hypothetical protein